MESMGTVGVCAIVQSPTNDCPIAVDLSVMITTHEDTAGTVGGMLYILVYIRPLFYYSF